MKRLIGLIFVVFIGVMAWRIGSRLSADALGMAVGLLFGVLAGVPTALLVMASGRRKEESQAGSARDNYGRQPHGLPMYGGYPQQAPVIVLAGHGLSPVDRSGGAAPNGYGYPALPPPQQVEARSYRVVGEKDEWVDEY